MEDFKLLPRILYVLQLLIYSAIASAVIKYIMPRWSLVSNLNIGNSANVDLINITALYLITLPILLLIFILWLKRY
jgi:hypothetical protein